MATQYAGRRRALKTSEIIARDIANEIVRQGMESGTMLPNERDMVEAFGVGRTTLREALRLLETRGVLTIKSGPGGGPMVRRPRASDLSESLTLILQFEQSSLSDVFEARRALEPTIARLATRRISAERLDDMQRSVDAMLANLENHEVFLEENQRFHTLIAEVSGNVVLSVFTETLKTVADGALAGVRYTPHRRGAVAQAHQRIVDAMRTGDAEAAALSMTDHLDEAGRYWARKYADLVARPVHWAQ